MSLLLTSSKCEQWTYLSKQVKEYEEQAVHAEGADLCTLMQRSAEAVFCCWKTFNAKQTLVITGNGNNAGDGYEVARLIKQADRHVVVCAINPGKVLTGDAAKAQKKWINAGGQICDFSQELLDECDAIVDALLGTGLTNNVHDKFAEMIKAVNQSAKPILSIDVPSGINADTGCPHGAAIMATKTVTLVGIKQGLTTATGKQYAGDLHFDDLGVGEQFMKLATPSAQIINIDSFRPLPERLVSSHKGSHGKLLCIGGNHGSAGAIRLSAESGLRAGAGMVKVYTHEHAVLPVSIGRPELMVTSEHLDDALAWSTCVVIGPGLGQDEWAQKTFERVIRYCQQYNMPTVIDADALNLLAKQSSSYKLSNTVLTPHPAEAARLLELTTTDIEADRFYYARQCAINFDATSILKGSGTLIDNTEHTWVCENGNPGLAVGGSGDVLSGIIGALMAQGLNSSDAACYGVVLHATAGDRACEQSGQRGMLASDLFTHVRALINHL